MAKLYFKNMNLQLSGKEIFKERRLIFNFLNLHDLYQFNKSPLFKKTFLSKANINCVDGFFPSFFLSLTNFKPIKRLRGPQFTKDFFENKQLSKNKKHFFIGLEKEDLKNLSLKFKNLNEKEIYSYNPPYIK